MDFFLRVGGVGLVEVGGGWVGLVGVGGGWAGGGGWWVGRHFPFFSPHPSPDGGRGSRRRRARDPPGSSWIPF